MAKKKDKQQPPRAKHTKITLDPDDEIKDDQGMQPVEMPKYKEDVSAFDGPVEEGKDFISRLPSETLDQILSYCLLDHDPERAVKKKAEGYKYVEQSHVLLSLASMSHHLHDHVEDFSRRHLIRHKDIYRFKTNAELVKQKETRRSDRLKAKTVQEDSRVYRMELVRHLQWYCFNCNAFCTRRATMVNGVACHGSYYQKCEDEAFGLQIVREHLMPQ